MTVEQINTLFCAVTGAFMIVAFYFFIEATRTLEETRKMLISIVDFVFRVTKELNEKE